MTNSNLERMVDFLVDYVVAGLAAKVTLANVGYTDAAPALKKIEKSVRVNLQYLPAAVINLDFTDWEEAGPGGLRAISSVDIVFAVAENDPAKLSIFLERYCDALVDLISADSTLGGSAYNAILKGMEKGIEPDGKRGVAVVTVEISGEFAT